MRGFIISVPRQIILGDQIKKNLIEHVKGLGDGKRIHNFDSKF
jgi:hypothetical protein